MRLIGKPGTPKNPKKFIGMVYRNALPDLTERDNLRLARLKQEDLEPPKEDVQAIEDVENTTSKHIEAAHKAHAKKPRTKKEKAKPEAQSNIEAKTIIEPAVISKPLEEASREVKEVQEEAAITEPETKPKPAKPKRAKRHPLRRLKQQFSALKPTIHLPQLHLPNLKPNVKPKTRPNLKPAVHIAIPHPAIHAKPLVTVSLLSLIPLGIAATQATLYVQPVAGAYVNAAMLAYLTGLALWQERYRALCIVVSLVPAATMVLLSLPDAAAFVRTATLYSFLLVFGLVYRHLIILDKPSRSDGSAAGVGLRGYGRLLPTMVIGGQLLGLTGYALLRSHYNFHDTLTPVVAASAVIFALAEEIVFRGLIQQQAMQVMKPVFAGALSTIIFASMAIGQGLPWTPLFALLLGAGLSYIYARKPNILLTWVVNVACKLTFLGLLSAIS